MPDGVIYRFARNGAVVYTGPVIRGLRTPPRWVVVNGAVAFHPAEPRHLLILAAVSIRERQRIHLVPDVADRYVRGIAHHILPKQPRIDFGCSRRVTPTSPKVVEFAFSPSSSLLRRECLRARLAAHEPPSRAEASGFLSSASPVAISTAWRAGWCRGGVWGAWSCAGISHGCRPVPTPVKSG